MCVCVCVCVHLCRLENGMVVERWHETMGWKQCIKSQLLMLLCVFHCWGAFAGSVVCLPPYPMVCCLW